MHKKFIYSMPIFLLSAACTRQEYTSANSDVNARTFISGPSHTELVFKTSLAAPACSPGEVDRMFASPGTELLKCSLTFPSGKPTLSRKIVLQGTSASNVMLDCNGGKIASPDTGLAIWIHSEFVNGAWQKPENILIRNCEILGSVRVSGMGINGEDAAVRISSQTLGHTERAQAAAPTRVIFENNKIVGYGNVPMYLSPGVTNVAVRGNEIVGKSSSVAIYFDAESASNQFVRNSVSVVTARESMAIDGSKGNLIAGNVFGSNTFGGLFLYRNCGEGGTVRHQTPVNNVIVNNYFYYNVATGGTANAAVFLGSRNGGKSYCEQDAGFPFGSSANNGDFADSNVVAENQIQKLAPADVIKNAGSNNSIYFNKQVTVKNPRNSPCAVLNGNAFLVNHSEGFDLGGQWNVCNDGIFAASQPKPVSGTRTIHRFGNAALNDYLLTTNPQEVSGGGWRYEGGAFVLNVDGAGPSLFRCSRGNSRHFLSGNAFCEGQNFEGELGRGVRNGGKNLYRCYRKSTDTALTTTNYSECASNGFAIEALLMQTLQ